MHPHPPSCWRPNTCWSHPHSLDTTACVAAYHRNCGKQSSTTYSLPGLPPRGLRVAARRTTWQGPFVCWHSCQAQALTSHAVLTHDASAARRTGAPPGSRKAIGTLGPARTATDPQSHMPECSIGRAVCGSTGRLLTGTASQGTDAWHGSCAAWRTHGSKQCMHVFLQKPPQTSKNATSAGGRRGYAQSRRLEQATPAAAILSPLHPRGPVASAAGPLRRAQRGHYVWLPSPGLP
jgi:hypothetical protein